MHLRVRPFALALLCVVLFSSEAYAGTGYRVTAKDGDKAVEYQVNFGGGRMFEQYTAFDPASNTFVYLRFNRGEEAPKPKAAIWDHTTGKKINLYQFPGVDQPLPVIPSIEDMKFCPMTGDADFVAEAVVAYD